MRSGQRERTSVHLMLGGAQIGQWNRSKHGSSLQSLRLAVSSIIHNLEEILLKSVGLTDYYLMHFDKVVTLCGLCL